MVVAMAIGGWYFLKRGKSQYEEALRQAQKNAMDAMREESESLRRRVEDIEKDNTRLNHLIESIYAALKAKKISVSVIGDTVDIRMEEETSP
jgi:uncharacterized protein HemX